MSGRLRCAFCAALFLVMFSAVNAFAVPSVPSQFVVEDVAPGANFNTPVGVAFFPGGRMLVAEKRGRVYTVVNGTKSVNPLWQADNEVLNNGDRGLLSVAVDPRYNGTTNRWIYLLYTVDPDSDGVDTNDDAFGRLIRIQVSATDSNTVDYSTRQVLFGTTWRLGPVSAADSHTIGTLRFAADGSLIVSVGDGAQYNSMDQGGQDPGAFGATQTDPYEDIGAFRAQYIGTLAGKILRLNPDTGQGYPSNPYWDGNGSSVRSRIWEYGLRNPFRFCLRPGTGSTDPAAGNPGTLYIGEVGWVTWEEMNVGRTGGLNFGWPCYEGFGQQSQYQGATPSHAGCGTLGTSENPATVNTAPLASWHHSNDALSIPSGFHGNTSIGGVFYTAQAYPTTYRNRYFFGDYGQSWVKVAVTDANDNLIQILPFGTAMDGPTDFNVDPTTGNVIYVSINTSQVRRIRYTGSIGGSNPPTAVISASPTSGAAPLAVNFSGAGSTDPDHDALTYLWFFGDGTTSTQSVVTHTYQGAGTFVAQLTVSDPSGNQDIKSVTINVGASSAGFPSTPVLDDFNRSDGPIGGAWTDEVGGLAISNLQLTQNCCYATTVWDGAVFGPNQEAYITFNTVTANCDEQDIMLKVQGTSYAGGHIEVRYYAVEGQVGISTMTPQTGWVGRGSPIPVTFAAGDQFGARALADGTIEVYKNGTKIGSASAPDWPFSASGGRLGLTMYAAYNTHFDNFGGGNVVFNSNTKPTATITAPVNGSFYYVGQTVALTGTGSDAQTPAANLTYQWVLDLHHNTHVHPAVLTLDGASSSFQPTNHDDGTGVYYEVKFAVTDPGGLSDTARVNIYPEVDLNPSPITVTPASPQAGGSTTYAFRLRNLGRMPAPISRWVLRAGNTALAQGDTIVAALDSVLISVTKPSLAAGTYTLRATADSLGTVVETKENNNVSVATMVVAPDPNNRAPVAVAGGTPVSGNTPLAVTFSSAGSADPDGDPITFAWAFGDGGNATTANPAHTYTTAGTYTALLTVTDNRGGSDTATVVITATAPPVTFPATAVLDNFNRSNGPIGKNWENSSGFSISSSQLKVSNGTPNTSWVGSTFGPNQEVFITLSTISQTAPEHILWLKVQNQFWYNGHIEISYQAPNHQVVVSTYDPQVGWVGRGTIPVTFVNGDQFGARARSNGTVTVYRNGVALGNVSVSGWRFAAGGGYIGMTFTKASASLMDNFGGGDAPASGAAVATAAESPAIEAAMPLPTAIALSSPMPNPSSGALAFSLDLPHAADVAMHVLDVQGRVVWESGVRSYDAGRWRLSWSGRTAQGPAQPGIYLVRVDVGGTSFTKRAAIIR